MHRPSLLFLFLTLFLISALLSESKKAHHKGNTKNKPATATDTFCKNFIKQCYHEGLDGKRGKVHIEYACIRQGPKSSKHFSFECKADGADLTKDVLNALEGGSTITNTLGSTSVVAGTVTNLATSITTINQEIDSILLNNITTTESATIVNVNTLTNTQTVTLTTVIPITATTTSISTVTTTTPVLATATSTVTSLYFNNQPIPVLRVSLLPPRRRRRVAQVVTSQFCSAYTTSCQTQCRKVKSKPKHLICESNNFSDFSLTCYCKNGKLKTQHALAAAVGQQNVVSVSTIDTSTSFGTVTSTTVVPTTVFSTSFAEVTSTIPVTNTYTSFSTATQTTILTGFTGTPTVVATTTPVSVATATATSFSTTLVTRTAHIVLAPTGRVEAFLQANGGSNGFVSVPNNGFAYIQPSTGTANTFAAVFDQVSGYYQLQATDGSGQVLASQEQNTGTSSPYYLFKLTQPLNCGTAGTTSGPAGTWDSSPISPCETFIFNPTSDNISLNSYTTNLLGELVGDGNTTATQYTWMGMEGGNSNLAAVTNPLQYQAAVHDSVPMTLRFPV